MENMQASTSIRSSTSSSHSMFPNSKPIGSLPSSPFYSFQNLNFSFPLLRRFTPCKPIAGTELSTFSLSMAMTSCNAHKIGLAGSVRFAVDGDGDVGLSSEIVDLVEKKKVEKEMGAEMVR
ncbi:hypothetical protein S83_000805 [Arachis hypogaea]